MTGLRVSLDANPLRRQLTNLEQTQLPFAGAMALNDVAKDVMTHMRERMGLVFDRPTRFTLNAFRMERASKAKLEASVLLKDPVRGRHFLKVEEAGGVRPQTGLEKALSQRLAYDGLIQSVVPAAAARRDAYGNWSPGERNQVLSALGAQLDKAANTTERSRKRNKGRANYFVPKTGLSPGVYRRDAPGAAPVKVLNFSESGATYTPRLNFERSAEILWRGRLPEYLARRLEQAVANAK